MDQKTNFTKNWKNPVGVYCVVPCIWCEDEVLWQLTAMEYWNSPVTTDRETWARDCMSVGVEKEGNRLRGNGIGLIVKGDKALTVDGSTLYTPLWVTKRNKSF